MPTEPPFMAKLLLPWVAERSMTALLSAAVFWIWPLLLSCSDMFASPVATMAERAPLMLPLLSSVIVWGVLLAICTAPSVVLEELSVPLLLRLLWPAPLLSS